MGHLADQNRARAAHTRRMSPWARICRAARRGTGLRLSAEDVARLAQDNAIMARGELDEDYNEENDG